ncbi:MAG: acyl-CoA dehydrogenase family protein [Chloroflexota bacterium]
MPAIAPTAPVLTEDMLQQFGERVAAYDRENRFFTEDFEDLRRSGYLLMPIPRELGGHGMNVAEVAREQRRLAYRAPATALATTMHLYWMGVAADLYRLGDDSLRWMLEEGARGEVYAAGHAEPGNDLPLLYSTAKAVRTDGGYRFTGRKSFGSLSPVWTRFGLHAMDTSDPSNPRVVHAFMPRDTPGYHIEETWDTLGMRATSSHDTVLEGAFVPDRYIGRVVNADFAGADLFVLAVFAWVEPILGSVYLGIADRALDLAISGIKSKTSVAQLNRTMAYHPEVQHTIADMVLALDGASAHVQRIANDWATGVDHGGAWPAKLVSAKYHAVETAKRVVDMALDVSGGSAMFKRNELERLYRDVRAGCFHPANSMLVHEIVGKTALGVLGEYPRWG